MRQQSEHEAAPASALAWMYAIARNRAWDGYRQTRRDQHQFGRTPSAPYARA
jgi:DNA-directed RNA polymerase specialized sigma24 family protein